MTMAVGLVFGVLYVSMLSQNPTSLLVCTFKAPVKTCAFHGMLVL